MRKIRTAAAGLSTLAMLLVASSASASAITVAATTAGCFGTTLTCLSFEDHPVVEPFEFDGTGFNVTTTAAGDWPDIVLGTFHRANANEGNFIGSMPFVLQITFTLPVGVIGGPDFYTAMIIGQLQGGGADAWVDFDNTPQTVFFANGNVSGSFNFAVQDLGTGVGDNGGVLGKDETITLLGGITNAQMVEINQTGASPVPEPASLLLLGGGLAAIAARARRRKKA